MSISHIFPKALFSGQTLCALILFLSSNVPAKELAVVPSCSTDAAGSTSCNVGVNPVPTLGPILDGGYQWLT